MHKLVKVACGKAGRRDYSTLEHFPKGSNETYATEMEQLPMAGIACNKN